jgi:EmrB/QacA subfamily drug resistance transporter
MAGGRIGVQSGEQLSSVIAPDFPSASRASHRGVALGVLCIAVLVVNLDNTILNVALPTLVLRVRASTEELQWIVDSYAMVFGGVLLVCGSLADRFGRRRLFIIGLATFGAGSLGAAFSGSVDPLIAWRAVMGAGAAATIPSGLSIVNDLFRRPAQRARAVGIWSGTIGLGIAVGPLAGGLLLSRFWWGSIFLVNIPVVVVGIVGALLVVPESLDHAARRPDPIGAVLAVTGLSLILWAIIEGPTHGWLSRSVLGATLTGAVVITVFVVWEHRSDHPMLPLRFFRARRFTIAVVAVALGVFALLGGLFVQTQYLQFGLGYSPLKAGLCILPIAGVLAAGALTSTVIVSAIGTRLTAAGGLVLIAAGLIQISAVSSVTASYAQVLPGMLLMGLGAGLLMPSATDSVLSTLTQDDAGVGSATNSTAIQVGGALGVAVVGSVLSSSFQGTLRPALAGHHVPKIAVQTILGSLGGALAVARLAGGALGAGLAHLARVGFAVGSHRALLVAGVVTGAGAILVLAAFPASAPPDRSDAQASDPRSDDPEPSRLEQVTQVAPVGEAGEADVDGDPRCDRPVESSDPWH